MNSVTASHDCHLLKIDNKVHELSDFRNFQKFFHLILPFTGNKVYASFIWYRTQGNAINLGILSSPLYIVKLLNTIWDEVKLLYANHYKKEVPLRFIAYFETISIVTFSQSFQNLWSNRAQKWKANSAINMQAIHKMAYPYVPSSLGLKCGRGGLEQHFGSLVGVKKGTLAIVVRKMLWCSTFSTCNFRQSTVVTNDRESISRSQNKMIKKYRHQY